MSVTFEGDKAKAAAMVGAPAPRCGFCGRFTPETVQWGPDRSGCDFVRVPTGPEPDDFLVTGCCARCALVIQTIQATLSGKGAGLVKGLPPEALELGRKTGAIGLLALISAAVDNRFDAGRPKDFQDLADQAFAMWQAKGEPKH